MGGARRAGVAVEGGLRGGSGGLGQQGFRAGWRFGGWQGAGGAPKNPEVGGAVFQLLGIGEGYHLSEGVFHSR